MFTGIIEEIGTVRAVRRHTAGVTLEIAAEKVLEGTRVGDSIATDGVCLTVTHLDGGGFSADVMHETLSRSTLGRLRAGDRVNLERAMVLGGRLGGHLVAGHVDARGRIAALRDDGSARWVTVETPQAVLRYVVEKGSVAIDGVSLTVAAVDRSTFAVSLIPHTQMQTALYAKRVGDEVNLEADMLVKYVEKLLGGQPATGGLTFEKLAENGF